MKFSEVETARLCHEILAGNCFLTPEQVIRATLAKLSAWDILRARIGEPPACSPEWATPEAKAVLDAMAAYWPEKRPNLWEAVHMATEAWTVSLKPKAVQLPEDWTLLSKNGHLSFTTKDRGEMERACAGFQYRVVEHREARDAPAQ